MGSRYVDMTTLHWHCIPGHVGKFILPLFHWKFGLASRIWVLLGDRYLEIYLILFLTPSGMRSLEWCIELVIKGLWGAMGTFVVPTTVTHRVFFTYPPTPPHPSKLWLEQRISNKRFRLFALLNPPPPSPPTHTHTWLLNFYLGIINIVPGEWKDDKLPWPPLVLYQGG